MSTLPLAEGDPPLDGNGVRFGIDWFAFTVKAWTCAQLVAVLVRVLGPEWGAWQVFKRGDGWERMRGPRGSWMEVNWRDRWVHTQIKGKGCRAVGVEVLLHLHAVLFTKVGNAYRPKRVDLAWDDYKKRLTPSQLREQFWDTGRRRKRANVVCRAKGGQAIEDDDAGGGGSYRVGQRCSNRMLRVYDKSAESGGEVDAIRFELVCKERVAVAAMDAMASAGGNRSGAALRFLVGFLDFREGVAGSSTRCAWWADLVGDAQRASIGRVERSDRLSCLSMFTHQNSSAVRVLVHEHGGDMLASSEELFRANPKDNPRHAGWHAEIERERAAKARNPPDLGSGGTGA